MGAATSRTAMGSYTTSNSIMVYQQHVKQREVTEINAEGCTEVTAKEAQIFVEKICQYFEQ